MNKRIPQPAKVLALAAVCAALLLASQSSIQDNVSSIGATVGDSITGITVAYWSFTGADGASVTAGSVSPTLSNGAFSVSLTPNAGTSGVYTATYTGNSGHTYTETWSVPVSSSTLKMSQLRSPGALLKRNDGTTYLMPAVTPAASSGSGTINSTAVPQWHKYTVAYTGLTAAATTQQVTLFTLPANGDIEGIRIKHSAAFAGPSITAMTVSIGSSANATGYAPAFNVFQAPSASTMYSDGGSFALTSAAHDVVAQFAATGANLGTGTATNLTAGSVDIWALWSLVQ